MSDLCRDPDDQLYRHMYDDEFDHNVPSEAVYWARGNSWVLISAAEYIDRVGVEDAGEVLPLFQSHMAAVVELQDESDGMWHTVMNAPNGDDPYNYTETSATALIGYAIARGMASGALDDSYRPALTAAIDGVTTRVEDDVVVGASVGTNPGNYDYYVAVPTIDDYMLGIGTVIMVLAEVDGTER
jgi:unsaturated rhamnogalacturonyl hydrolase